MCCSVFQCVVGVLQCVVGVLHFAASRVAECCSGFRFAAVGFGLLQCVAVCCSVLQCVAVY